MKILVLENDPQEFALIQQALNSERNTLTLLMFSEHTWQYIKSGQSRFLIANWDTSDLRSTQFISRVQAAKLTEPLYILLTTAKNSDDEDVPAGADDIIQRPFKAPELKNKVAIGERIISLSSSLATARKQLEIQAMFDSLTGFMNRAAFFKQAAGELDRARRASMPVSLIVLNIENFKWFNETLGTKTANEILRVLSQSIREKSRPYDCIGRWSEDKFVFMLSGVLGADAEKAADRIIAGVRGTRIELKNEEAPLNIKISAGIASVSRIGTSTEVELLMEQALQAMLRAKEAGDNQVFMVYV
ncbi:MAG: diguanylate cyclase [Anaerolineales bacterium]|nr:diguanylate cyclase [Anaerolineales bacterium]